jgi:hypothetical protein
LTYWIYIKLYKQLTYTTFEYGRSTMISLSGNEDGSIFIVDLKPIKTHLDFNNDVISSIKETNFSIFIPNIDFYYSETFSASRIKYINQFLNKVYKLSPKKHL